MIIMYTGYLEKVKVSVVVLDKVRLIFDTLHGGVGMQGKLGEPKYVHDN
jgi:hypothetical protein